jgi:hypothetical protein
VDGWWTTQGEGMGGGGQSKAIGQQEAVSTAMAKTLTAMRGEEAMATITIMTTIKMTKVGGGCEGTTHPTVGGTYNVVVIMLNANTRSSSMTTSALVTVVMMAVFAVEQGELV